MRSQAGLSHNRALTMERPILVFEVMSLRCDDDFREAGGIVVAPPAGVSSAI